RAPVFRDTTGSWHALQDLRQVSEVWTTTLSPPYPAQAFERPILSLAEHERVALRGTDAVAKLALVDKNALVERAHQAIARRAAPPLSRVEVPRELRSQCLC